MGLISFLVRAGSKPIDGKLEKGVGLLGSSKGQSPNTLVMGWGCGPKGHNTCPFKGLAVGCSPRPFKGLEIAFEGPIEGAFEAGPGKFCLGLAVEEDKAKSSLR